MTDSSEANALLPSPSFFELLAANELFTLLTPAVQYILSFFAQRNHRRLWLAEWSDELLLLGRTLLEFHYLKYYDATFAEYFYDLKRVISSAAATPTATVAGATSAIMTQLVADGVASRSSNSNNRKLTALKRLALLILVVFVPYVKQKLDRLYESNRDAETRRVRIATIRRATTTTTTSTTTVATTSIAHDENAPVVKLLTNVFQHMYPFVHAFGELTSMAFALAFMYDRTRSYSPVDYVSGTNVVRIDAFDAAQSAQKLDALRQQRWQSLSLRAPISSLYVLAALFTSRAFDTAKPIIAPVVMAYRFFDWWYANESTLTSGNVFIPSAPLPPVIKAKPINDIVAWPVPSGVCPLCRRQRTNDAIAATSGVAYCYPCIYRYATTYEKCPVTDRTLLPTDIIKIFV